MNHSRSCANDSGGTGAGRPGRDDVRVAGAPAQPCGQQRPRGASSTVIGVSAVQQAAATSSSVESGQIREQPLLDAPARQAGHAGGA